MAGGKMEPTCRFLKSRLVAQALAHRGLCGRLDFLKRQVSSAFWPAIGETRFAFEPGACRTATLL